VQATPAIQTMKTLFKLAIVALLANALVRFAVPYWHHQEFASAVKARAFDWRDSSDETILLEVLDLAVQSSVPIGREQITLRREEGRVLLDIAYSLPIEFVPTISKPWTFELSVTGRTMQGSLR